MYSSPRDAARACGIWIKNQKRPPIHTLHTWAILDEKGRGGGVSATEIYTSSSIQEVVFHGYVFMSLCLDYEVCGGF